MYLKYCKIKIQCTLTECWAQYVPPSKIPTPSSRGVEKYGHSVSSDLTKEHSITPSLPFTASKMEKTNRAPAYAIDKVADPVQLKDQNVDIRS